MFKIALNAGHGLYAAGKRCTKSIDPNETREWVLNSRICEKIENILSNYEGYELLRTDDPSGKINITLKKRVETANKWGAHIYLSIHHSNGIKGGSGGGITVYSYTATDDTTGEWKAALYNALIKHTGLRGDRIEPLATADLRECRETTMPAVLIKCGFMDSTTDTPIILTEKFSDECATAISEVLIQRCGLVLKDKTSKPLTTERMPDVIYRVFTAKSGWLPNVINDSGYAGVPLQPIRCIYAELTDGDVEYQAHTLGGKWLPWVKNHNDYAGLYGKDIDCVRVRLIGNSRYSVQYRVAPVSGDYRPWVTDNSDYAGVYGKKIDRLQIRIVEK